MNEEEEGTSTTIHRVILLLHTFPRFNGKWFGVSQVAEAADMPKSTVHRYLQALIQEGVVEYSDDMPGLDFSLPVRAYRVRVQGSEPEPETAYKAMETALQLLTGNILSLRTELLVIKAEIMKDKEP
jgi:DNA-binding IclR family transcriptional regulator